MQPPLKPQHAPVIGFMVVAEEVQVPVEGQGLQFVPEGMAAASGLTLGGGCGDHDITEVHASIGVGLAVAGEREHIRRAVGGTEFPVELAHAAVRCLVGVPYIKRKWRPPKNGGIVVKISRV